MEHVLIELASVLVLGMVAQWLAWRLRVPSILLLLIFGFVAGPVTGFLDPEGLFGALLVPLVSLSVGIILFEGGLTLKLIELRHVGKVVRNLNSVGAVVTWLLASLAAHYILGLSWPLAVLMGAILIVTGPTVIGPLLRHVGNVGAPSTILKWEGILIDPIGATMALLVFEAIAADTAMAPLGSDLGQSAVGFLRTAIVGGLIGAAGAMLLIAALKRHWVPDFLQNPVTLMLVVGAFALSNELQHESGLLATTVMGIMLANAREVDAQHILEFKENLSVLLISSLFIILSARLDISVLREVNLRMVLFLLAMLLLVRPLSVLASTAGSTLSWRERLFIAWLAPRGIVAAAVASIFGLELAEQGYTEAERLGPLVFLVIVGTVLVYGLTASPVARLLGLVQKRRGLLIAGAHDWAREMGRVLHEQGLPVLLVDNNRDHVLAAQYAGLPTMYGNILSEFTEDRVEMAGMGRLLALTANDEINSLAALNFADVFGKEEVYQLAPQRDEQRGDRPSVPRPLRGHTLFSRTATSEALGERFKGGATLRATPITAQFSYDEFRALHGASALPLFVVRGDGSLLVLTDSSDINPQPGQTLISLVDPAPAAAPQPALHPAIATA